MSADLQYGYNSLQRDFQQQQQVSFHFWSCQLTEASPRYRWEPESASAAGVAAGNGDRPKRHSGRHGDESGNGDKAKDAEANGDHKATENGRKSGKSGEKAGGETAENGEAVDGEDVKGEAVADADYMQHVLKVNACILGPKAVDVHLIAVRTRCYRQAEPESCPIVCIDPASQRTVALGYEFVLDSQNEVVTFELVEGAGPVWLTGLHQVRMHDADAEGDDTNDGEVDAESGEEADESMDLSEDVEEEEEEDDEEDEEEEEEAARPVAKRVARASKTDQQRPVASPKKRQPPTAKATAAATKNGGRKAGKKT